MPLQNLIQDWNYRQIAQKILTSQSKNSVDLAYTIY